MRSPRSTDAHSWRCRGNAPCGSRRSPSTTGTDSRTWRAPATCAGYCVARPDRTRHRDDSGNSQCPRPAARTHGSPVALALVRQVAPDPRLGAVRQFGQQARESCTLAVVVATEWISLCRLSTPICAFMPKCGSLPLLVWCISGSRSPSRYLVELGALMIRASMIVPVMTVKPRTARWALTVARICGPRSWASSRWRNLQLVVSSSTSSRPKSMPTNSRIIRVSYSASSAAGSERLASAAGSGCATSARAPPAGGPRLRPSDKPVRSDRSAAPRHHPVRIGQTLLAPRALAVTLKPACSQCLLLRSHRFTIRATSLTKCTILGSQSESL